MYRRGVLLARKTCPIVAGHRCLIESAESTMSGQRFISAEEVKKVLKYEDLIPAIESSLVDFSDRENGGVVQPVRSTIEVAGNNGHLYTMPCYSKKVESLVAKMVTRFPEQSPAHHSTIILFNSETGSVQSIMDGEVITSMRTAAASAVALKYLSAAEKKEQILCILGSGKQAHSHLDAFKFIRNFKEVRVWSRTSDNAHKFTKDTGAIPYDNAQAAVKNADVIVTATSATVPILFGDWVKPGAFVCSVGAPFHKYRELDDSLMHKSTVIVDSYEGAMSESGDIILSKAQISGELGEVISKRKAVELGKTVLFKSLGMAVYDAVSAKLVFEKYNST